MTKGSINSSQLPDETRTALRRADMLRLQSNSDYLAEREVTFTTFKNDYRKALKAAESKLDDRVVEALAEHDLQVLKLVQNGHVPTPEEATTGYCRALVPVLDVEGLDDDQVGQKLAAVIRSAVVVREDTVMEFLLGHDQVVQKYLGYSLYNNIFGQEDPLDQFKKP